MSRAQEREDGARNTRDEEARRRDENLTKQARLHTRRRKFYDRTFNRTWQHRRELRDKLKALQEEVRRAQKDMLPDATCPLGKEAWNTLRRDVDHPLNADQAEVVPTPVRPGEHGGSAPWYSLGDVIRKSALVDSVDAVSMDTDDDRKRMARVVDRMRQRLRQTSAEARRSQYLRKVADFREDSMWLIVSGSFRRYAENPFPGSKASVAFDDQVYTVRTRSSPALVLVVHAPAASVINCFA